MTTVARFRSSLDRLMAHQDRDVRLQAARCVGRLPGSMIVGQLRALAEDPDHQVRREALATLAERAPAAGRAVLRHAFKEDGDLECRRAALVGLVRLQDRDLLPAIRRLIRNPDAFSCAQAPATRASRQALCCEAVAALAVLGDPSVVPDLTALLERHVAPSLDDTVIRALAQLGARGRAAIADMVHEAPAHRARSAVAALAAADSSETDAIAMFLNHEDASVRQLATATLARLAPSHSALIRRLDDRDPVIRALVAQHAGPTMPALLDILVDDPAPEVAVAALAAVSRVASSERNPDMIWRVRRMTRSSDTAVACEAMRTVAEIAPSAATAYLRELAADSGLAPSVRLTAVRLLADRDEARLLPQLAVDLASDDPEFRRGVLDALGRLARRRDDEQVVIVLTDALTADARPPRRRSARTRGRASVATAYADPVPKVDLSEASPETRRLLRREIADVLANIPSTLAAETLAEVVLATTDDELARTAARSLAALAERLPELPPAVLPAARQLAGHADEAQRLAGIRVLASRRDPASVTVMLRALDDADPGVRACAVRWLGAVNMPLDAAVVARLTERLGDRNSGVRLAAMAALATRRGDQAAGFIIDAAITAGDETMPAVAACLRRLTSESVHRELARRLACAQSRNRQLALLRLSDSILTDAEAAVAA